MKFGDSGGPNIRIMNCDRTSRCPHIKLQAANSECGSLRSTVTRSTNLIKCNNVNGVKKSCPCA
jgi:hypothetical protein